MRAGGLAGSVAIGTVVGWTMSNVGAVAPELSRDYRLSIATVGLLTTVAFVVHTLMQLPAGRVVDRLGPKKVGLIGMSLVIAFNLLTVPAAEPWLVFLMRTLLGVGTGLSFMSGIEYARQTTGSPLVVGMFGASTGLGGGLAVAIVPQVEHAIAWRAPFVSAAVLGGLALVILALGPPDRLQGRRIARATAASASGPAAAPAPAVHPAAPPAPAGSPFRDLRIWRLGLSMAIPGGMSLILGTWVVTLLVEAGGYTTREAGLIGSLSMVGGIVTRPFSGWLMRHHPQRMVAVIALSSVAGAGGALMLAEARILPLVIAGSLVVGLACGMPFSYGYAIAPRVRPDAPGVASAIVNASGLTVIVCCIPLVGLGFSLPGHGRVGFFVAAGVWLASILLLPRGPYAAPGTHDAPRGRSRGARAGGGGEEGERPQEALPVQGDR